MKIERSMLDRDILHELGIRIAALRISKKMTQAILAECAGVSKRTIERMESGKVSIQMTVFIRVLRAVDGLERLEMLLPHVSAGPVDQVLSSVSHTTRRRVRKPRDLARSTPWKWGE